jgi:hypothetical protein
MKASKGDENEVAAAHRIMWNQHSRKRKAMQYRIIAAKDCEEMAKEMEEVRTVQLEDIAKNPALDEFRSQFNLFPYRLLP